MVLVDVDKRISVEDKSAILQVSDAVVITFKQGLEEIEEIKQLREQYPDKKKTNIIFMMGKYDVDSKYNVKNITRYLGEKNQVLTIPYNTLFFEASDEAGVPDLFLRFKKFLDPEDRNAFFIQEIKRASESIIYRIQAIQAGL